MDPGLRRDDLVENQWLRSYSFAVNPSPSPMSSRRRPGSILRWRTLTPSQDGPRIKPGATGRWFMKYEEKPMRYPLLTKLSSTFLGPAFSKSMLSLLPSTAVTVP